MQNNNENNITYKRLIFLIIITMVLSAFAGYCAYEIKHNNGVTLQEQYTESFKKLMSHNH